MGRDEKSNLTTNRELGTHHQVSQLSQEFDLTNRDHPDNASGRNSLPADENLPRNDPTNGARGHPW